MNLSPARIAILLVTVAIVAAAVYGAQAPAAPSAMDLQRQAEQGAVEQSQQQLRTEQFQFQADNGAGNGAAAATDLGRVTIEQGELAKHQLNLQAQQAQQPTTPSK